MKAVLESLIFLLQRYHDHEDMKDLDKALLITSFIVDLKKELNKL